MGRVILAAAQADPALDVVAIVDVAPRWWAGRWLSWDWSRPG